MLNAYNNTHILKYSIGISAALPSILKCYINVIQLQMFGLFRANCYAFMPFYYMISSIHILYTTTIGITDWNADTFRYTISNGNTISSISMQ